MLRTSLAPNLDGGGGGNMVPMTDYLGVNIGFKLKLTMLSKRRKERQANKKSSGLFFVTNCNAKARQAED